jgi:hypothetical protein
MGGDYIPGRRSLKAKMNPHDEKKPLENHKRVENGSHVRRPVTEISLMGTTAMAGAEKRSIERTHVAL